MLASQLAGHVRGPCLRSPTRSITRYLPALALSTAKLYLTGLRPLGIGSVNRCLGCPHLKENDRWAYPIKSCTPS
jgi:hypothetical protein